MMTISAEAGRAVMQAPEHRGAGGSGYRARQKTTNCHTANPSPERERGRGEGAAMGQMARAGSAGEGLTPHPVAPPARRPLPSGEVGAQPRLDPTWQACQMEPAMIIDLKTRAETLPCWRGPVAAEPLPGGMTNTNFVVRDGGERFVVRIGDDIPVHQVMRFNERAASLAAHAAGLSPELIHAEPGALVMRFVEGRTLAPEDVRRPEMLPRVVELVRRCHREVPRHLRGPVLMFWPFHVLRNYAATLEE